MATTRNPSDLIHSPRTAADSHKQLNIKIDFNGGPIEEVKRHSLAISTLKNKRPPKIITPDNPRSASEIKETEKLAYKQKLQLFEESKQKRFLSSFSTSANVLMSGSMKTSSHFYNG